MTENETSITAACKAWRAVLPVHSACEVIPAYDDCKLISLGRDIKQSGGCKLPIIILMQPNGTFALLDGRSRLDALCHVGIKFEIKIVGGHVVIDAPGYDIPAPIEIAPDASFNAYAFVLSVNLHRRQLKNAQKRNITKEVIRAQPGLSDRAIARMAGVDGKTVKQLRLEIAGNAEIRIGDRVEATGRKARGRKPSEIAKPIEARQPNVAHAASITPVADIPATQIDEKPPAAPITVSPPKPKSPGEPNGFNAEKILEVAQRASAILERPVSAPNRDAARKEVLHLIDLLLQHKSLKPAERRAA
jgi:hypothetical protein